MKCSAVTPTDNPDGRTPFVGEDPLILPLLQRALRSIQRSANLLQRADVGIGPYGRGERFSVRISHIRALQSNASYQAFPLWGKVAHAQRVTDEGRNNDIPLPSDISRVCLVAAVFPSETNLIRPCGTPSP